MRMLGSLLSLFALAGLALAGTPTEAVAAALADARRLAPDDALQTRYLWTGNLSADERAACRRAVQFWANSLSRRGLITVPRDVTPELIALDCSKYKWDREVYGRFRLSDPYFHVQVIDKATKERDGLRAPWLPQAEMDELETLTHSVVPILRADFFVAQTARQTNNRNDENSGTGYYDFLGLKSRADLFALTDLDVEKSKAIERDLRAALNKSKVSNQGRQIVRFQARTGCYWVTLDPKDATGKGDPVQNLRPEDFAHDAEEVVACLPNRLPLYWAGTADGKRQASAPDFIGGDTSPPNDRGNDKRIHVGVSCVRCHIEDALRPINDWARRTLRSPLALTSTDKALRDEFERLYFQPLGSQLEEDRRAFDVATLRACGVRHSTAALALSDTYGRYLFDDVTLEVAAAECGLKPKQLQEQLRAYGVAQAAQPQAVPPLPVAVTGLLHDTPEPLTRLDWEQSYGVTMIALQTVKGKRVEALNLPEITHGEALAWLQSLPDGCANGVLTDPPYSSGGTFKGDRNKPTEAKYLRVMTTKYASFVGDTMDQRSWTVWCSIWLRECKRVCAPESYCLVWTDWRMLPSLTDAFQAGGWTWRGIVPWDKTDAVKPINVGYFRHQCEYVVWGTNSVSPLDRKGPWPGCYTHYQKPADKLHQTAKPIPVLRQLVKCVKPGGLILDPFAGSGSVAVACRLEGRRSAGCEIGADYYQIATERLSRVEWSEPAPEEEVPCELL